MKNLRRLWYFLPHLQPVAEIIRHVVAAEGKHGHGVPPRDAYLACRGRGGFARHGCAHEYAVLPVKRFIYQRGHSGSSSSKYERRYRHAFRRFPFRRNAWRLARRHGVPRIRMRRRAFGWIPRLALPVGQPSWRIAANSFPPRLPLGSHRHVRKQRVLVQRSHHVLIGFHTRARSHPKKARFRIDGVQISVFADLHPGNIVSNGPDAIPLVLERRHHHCQIRFPARAWKRRAHVGYFAARRFQPQDQHVLGHPALLARHHAGNPQRKTLFSEQRVSAVARPHAPDQFLLRKVNDVSPRGIQVAQ